MNRGRKLLAAALALTALVTTALTATPAEAHRFWRPWFGFSFAAPVYYAPPPPVYVVPPPPVYYGYRYRVVHRYYRPVRHYVHRVVHRSACSCACCPK